MMGNGRTVHDRIRVRGPERSYFIPARAWLDREVGLWGLRLGATFRGNVFRCIFDGIKNESAECSNSD